MVADDEDDRQMRSLPVLERVVQKDLHDRVGRSPIAEICPLIGIISSLSMSIRGSALYSLRSDSGTFYTGSAHGESETRPLAIDYVNTWD